jgi:DNA polymerase V
VYTIQIQENIMLARKVQKSSTSSKSFNRQPEISYPKSVVCSVVLNRNAVANVCANVPLTIKPRLHKTCTQKLGIFAMNCLPLPHFATLVPAGYPSSADDSLNSPLDLTKYLIRHPKTTYYVTATGYSMIEAGIFDKDILVVDSALEPRHGSIVIAVVNGEFTVKRLHKDESQIILLPANPDYTPLTITKEMSFFIQGVVTSVIHQFRPLH